MIFLSHILPKARAFRLSPITKRLTEWFQGLDNWALTVQDFVSYVFLDLWPASSRCVDLWENQFGLDSSSTLTDDERRSRLDAKWKAVGGQSPRYIQDTLQNAGFDIYVHEWWVPGSNPPLARNPLELLENDETIFQTECGELLAECGEVDAYCGLVQGTGELIVNKIQETRTVVTVLCGESLSECGEVDAMAGNFTDIISDFKQYVIPSDPSKFPYFIYFGAETFGQNAIVYDDRQAELCDLLLSICPAHLWIGLFVNYIPRPICAGGYTDVSFWEPLPQDTQYNWDAGRSLWRVVDAWDLPVLPAPATQTWNTPSFRPAKWQITLTASDVDPGDFPFTSTVKLTTPGFTMGTLVAEFTSPSDVVSAEIDLVWRPNPSDHIFMITTSSTGDVNGPNITCIDFADA